MVPKVRVTVVGRHACKVVRPGRSFLRRVFKLLQGVDHDHHYIRLNRAMRSDLTWWDQFLNSWNGVSLLHPARLSSPMPQGASVPGSFLPMPQGASVVEQPGHATGSSFCGHRHISRYQLPLKSGAYRDGMCRMGWKGQVVHVHSDNDAVVAVVNSGYSKDPQLKQLVRSLFLVLAAWDIALYACHIPGVLNTVADAISRDNIPLLFSKCQRPITTQPQFQQS